MNSEGRRQSLLLVMTLAWLGACGGSVHDLSVMSGPLLVLHGHVDISQLQRKHPGVPLLGALVWAGLPAVNPVCVDFDAAELKAACPDPYGVFYGEIERAAPVDGDGNFDLALFHLPMASVSVGDQVTRIAYGSLIVVEDVNGDGQPSFVPRPGRRDGVDLLPLTNVSDADVIVAASFSTLKQGQQRVVFREGGFVRGSAFYPAPPCDDPPPGFSIEVTPPYAEPPLMPSGPCSSLPIGTRIVIPPLPSDEAAALMCRPVQRSTRIEAPSGDNDNRPDPQAKLVCLAPDILAVIAPGTCPRVTSLALKGCAMKAPCDAPEWNVTANPPSWWPCH